VNAMLALTTRDRVRRVLDFKPVDRLPIMEWAIWWDATLDRWRSEGMPAELGGKIEVGAYFGLDADAQYWIGAASASCPRPAGHGLPIVKNAGEYAQIKQHLYPEEAFDKDAVRSIVRRQESGEVVVWITLEGFFWWPRVLLGIEPHLCAFYDQPDLIKQINEDLLAFQSRAVDEFCQICVPDFMTFAEDMSYNHGPMLSKAMFDEFVAPYYARIVPVLRDHGIVPVMDSDGDVTDLIGWAMEQGIQGILPLERMAGVDVGLLRRRYPGLIMMGGFDKTVMHLGEHRIREEFERLLPVMRQGGFIPSVDHQTPPGVSIDDYRTYARLLGQYCKKACR